MAAIPSLSPEAAACRRAMLELGAYLASAASLLESEPSDYAQFRLLEGVLRVLRALARLDPSRANLSEAAAKLEARLVPTKGDPHASARLADELAALFAQNLIAPAASTIG